MNQVRIATAVRDGHTDIGITHSFVPETLPEDVKTRQQFRAPVYKARTQRLLRKTNHLKGPRGGRLAKTLAQ